jgi:hypothetical protein
MVGSGINASNVTTGTLSGSLVGANLASSNVTTGVLLIANGGTGATTAAVAMTNLGTISRTNWLSLAPYTLTTTANSGTTADVAVTAVVGTSYLVDLNTASATKGVTFTIPTGTVAGQKIKFKLRTSNYGVFNLVQFSGFSGTNKLDQLTSSSGSVTPSSYNLMTPGEWIELIWDGVDSWQSTGNFWIKPNLGNSWAVYTSCNPTFGVPMFTKDANQIVHLRGLMKATAGGCGNPFTLPVGYRPAKYHLHTGMRENGGAFMAIRIDTYNDGTFNTLTCDTGWVSFDHISFMAGE